MLYEVITPETSTKANRETSFMELPVRYIRIMVTRKANGMPIVVKAAFLKPMNPQIMAQTRIIPTHRFTPRTFTESSIRRTVAAEREQREVLPVAERQHLLVITSYSIHYTKLYEKLRQVLPFLISRFHVNGFKKSYNFV